MSTGPGQREVDTYESDGYYLAAPKAVKPKRRSGFGAPRPHPCPACFTPKLVVGYCDRCEASGAADTHRSHADGDT